jgi:hypothetical protein
MARCLASRPPRWPATAFTSTMCWQADGLWSAAPLIVQNIWHSIGFARILVGSGMSDRCLCLNLKLPLSQKSGQCVLIGVLIMLRSDHPCMFDRQSDMSALTCRISAELKTEIDSASNPTAKLKLFNDWFYNNMNIARVELIHKARKQLKKTLKEEFCFMNRVAGPGSCFRPSHDLLCLHRCGQTIDARAPRARCLNARLYKSSRVISRPIKKLVSSSLCLMLLHFRRSL